MGRAKSVITRTTFLTGVPTAGCVIATATLILSVVGAQMDNVKTAMAALKTKTEKLGAPRVEGSDSVAGMDLDCSTDSFCYPSA